MTEETWSVSNLAIRNGRDIPTATPPTTIEADVCVIGSGPAGISAAWKLGQAGLRVILLDGSRQLNYPPPLGSGGECYFQKSWSDKAELYNGVATGIFQHNDERDFLIRPSSAADYIQPCEQRWNPFKPWERERVFGGTATHGGGQCRPQDTVDIEGRDFQGKTIFPRWPIPAGELDEAYKETSVANNLFGDYPENFTTAFWEKTLGPTTPIPPLDGFDVEMYQWMGTGWKNFATRPWGQSRQPINHFAQVIVNATVLDIVVQNGKVDHLEVASMEDKYPDENPPNIPKVATKFNVKAGIYILACGAVENARQLLLSKIGDKKLVGHYFMCHPLSQDEVIFTSKPYLLPDQLNFMDGRYAAGNKWAGSPGSSLEGRFITNRKTTIGKGIGRCWFWASAGGGARMYFEMAPNYESCVELDEDGPRDPVFGQKRTKIHWCLDNIVDKRTYEENCKEFQQNVRVKGGLKGEISYTPWEEIGQQWVPNGHHMGTTRMSVKPEEGVVDENLKVHGVGNLYVAGSSVFPSGGISNPTMTIVALSLRLAGHIKKRLAEQAKS